MDTHEECARALIEFKCIDADSFRELASVILIDMKQQQYKLQRILYAIFSHSRKRFHIYIGMLPQRVW